jgi:PDZ domain-containing protein
MLQEGQLEGSRTRRWVQILAVAATMLFVSGIVGALVVGANDYFAVSPGSAPVVSAESTCRPTGNGSYSLPSGAACVRIIVPPDQVHPVVGSVLMVDVLEGPATVLDYLFDKVGLLHRVYPGTQLVPAPAILGSTPPAQLACQNTQAMTDATQSASVVALRRLGYTVTENDLGALVVLVVPNTPAAAADIRCNDLIVAINGVPVHTNSDLVNQVHKSAPGDTLRLTVKRPGPGGVQKTVELTAKLSGTPAQPGQAARPNEPFLGLATSTDTTYTFPFHVTISVGSIGGPSAGLALSLGLLDALSAGQLTGGHKIAATGTIDVDGNVGAIGGASQKAIAVRKAGAQVFFVPAGQNYRDALTEAGSMKVYAVSTLQQALNDLEALGGQVPPPQPAPSGSG